MLTRSIVLVAALTACADNGSGESNGPGGSNGPGDSIVGTYQVTRTVTQWEPSPAFDFPTTITLTLTADHAQVSSSFESVWTHATGSGVTFDNGEKWPSPEGDGAVNLSYDLQLPGDGTVSGTIAAHVIFDTPTSGHDFDYTLSVTGQRE